MPLIGSADQPTATSRGSEETSTTSPGEQVVFRRQTLNRNAAAGPQVADRS